MYKQEMGQHIIDIAAMDTFNGMMLPGLIQILAANEKAGLLPICL
jgi:hypothetical protein